MSDTGSDYFGALKAVVGFAAIAWLVAAGCRTTIGGEEDGTIKYDDCRAKYSITPKSWRTIVYRFTCETQHTASGKRMAATCTHVDLSYGQCDAAYTYIRGPEVVCPPPTPYLDFDDKCYAEYSTGRVLASPQVQMRELELR